VLVRSDPCRVALLKPNIIKAVQGCRRHADASVRRRRGRRAEFWDDRQLLRAV